MAGSRLEEDQPDAPLFSADLGEDRIIRGGKRLAGKRVLYFNGVQIYRGRLDDEMAAKLVSFSRDLATRNANEFVRIRAGAVTLDGGAVAFPSTPEPHLPALVSLLVRAGAGYLGDEEVHVDPVLWKIHATGVPILLDEDDLALLPELVRESNPRKRRQELRPESRGLTPRRLVTPEEVGGRFADPAPLRWIVLPEFVPGADTRLEALGGSGALFQLTRSVLNLHAWGDRALLLLRDLLDMVPTSRLVVGSIPEASDLVVQAAPGIMEGVSE